MLRRLWHVLCIAALGAAMAGVSHTATVPDQPLPRTTLSALHLPGVDPGTTVVTATLADIDADGDLDVIASDGSLDLLVWNNDGTGHFTRKYPVHGPPSSSFGRDGSFDPGSGTLPVSVLPSGASFVAADRLTRAMDSSEWGTAPAPCPLRSRALLARASRAPPLTLRSA